MMICVKFARWTAELARAAELEAQRYARAVLLQRQVGVDDAVGLDAAAGVVLVVHERGLARQREQDLVDEMRSDVDEDAAAAGRARLLRCPPTQARRTRRWRRAVAAGSPQGGTGDTTRPRA
jgi:hypothetical protein